MLDTLRWTGDALELLDQTLLPTETRYVRITDEKQTWDAIKRLVVRGAPAIGVAAAFGVYLGVAKTADDNASAFTACLNEVCDYLITSRPTAVNLAWAVERIRRLAKSHRDVAAAKRAILAECLAMHDEDIRVCRAIGEHSLTLLQSNSKNSAGEIGVLTHCNAGSLATVRFGTALSPFYVGAERGIRFHVYADETRPLLQGSRITAYELQAGGIPVTVICDNMAATVMSQGKVSAVIVGTDRVAANGDAANKIGTLGVAILARHYGLPFYVAAPTSSIDLSLASGKQIPIEQRDSAEISRGLGKQTAPNGVDIFNPAFDVTPANLVSAIITERGIARAPYEKSLAEMCAKELKSR